MSCLMLHFEFLLIFTSDLLSLSLYFVFCISNFEEAFEMFEARNKLLNYTSAWQVARASALICILCLLKLVVYILLFVFLISNFAFSILKQQLKIIINLYKWPAARCPRCCCWLDPSILNSWINHPSPETFEVENRQIRKKYKNIRLLKTIHQV